jgi:acyl-CoA thioester hydrolase
VRSCKLDPTERQRGDPPRYAGKRLGQHSPAPGHPAGSGPGTDPRRPASYDPRVTNLETGRLSDKHPPFRYSALSRVSFSDTDAQGVVYYGRYLPYFDNARLEYHRHLGLQAYWQGEREFVMRSLEVTYEAPARFDELLDVHVRTTRIGHSSVTVEGAAYLVDDHRLMCTARMTLVMIDVVTRRPVPVPEGYRRAIAAFEGDGVSMVTA